MAKVVTSRETVETTEEAMVVGVDATTEEEEVLVGVDVTTVEEVALAEVEAEMIEGNFEPNLLSLILNYKIIVLRTKLILLKDFTLLSSLINASISFLFYRFIHCYG